MREARGINRGDGLPGLSQTHAADQRKRLADGETRPERHGARPGHVPVDIDRPILHDRHADLSGRDHDGKLAAVVRLPVQVLARQHPLDAPLCLRKARPADDDGTRQRQHHVPVAAHDRPRGEIGNADDGEAQNVAGPDQVLGRSRQDAQAGDHRHGSDAPERP